MKEYIVPINNTDRDDDEIFVGFIRKRDELIRCKDCTKNGTDDCAMYFIDNNDNGKYYQWDKADDFCSWAERKEE